MSDQQCEATTHNGMRCQWAGDWRVNGHGYCWLHVDRERRKGTLDEQLDAWLRQNPRRATPAWLRGRAA